MATIPLNTVTMNQTTLKNRNRKILQVQAAPIGQTSFRDPDLSPDPIFQPINISGSAGETTRTASFKLQRPSSPFDSSMALTIMVLLTALFFMGFFSIYIRRFAEEESTDVRRRRNPSQPSLLPASFSGNHHKCKGLDPSTIGSLPLVSYSGDAKHMISDCPICLTEFEQREIVKLIPHCKHVFHPPCIDTWLKSHVSCPLCRSTQLFKMPDEESCLDVKVGEEDNCDGNDARRMDGGSTADGSETWRQVRAGGVRRSYSSASSCDRLVLQRSMSF